MSDAEAREGVHCTVVEYERTVDTPGYPFTMCDALTKVQRDGMAESPQTRTTDAHYAPHYFRNHLPSPYTVSLVDTRRSQPSYSNFRDFNTTFTHVPMRPCELDE